MKIKINKFTICSDEQSMWIERDIVSKDGKEYSKRASGYYQNFSQLAKGFADTMVRTSEATTIKGLLADFSECEKVISNLIAEADEQCKLITEVAKHGDKGQRNTQRI